MIGTQNMQIKYSNIPLLHSEVDAVFLREGPKGGGWKFQRGGSDLKESSQILKSWGGKSAAFF